MIRLPLFVTKNVHFSYSNDIYTQTDGVAVGSSNWKYIYD